MFCVCKQCSQDSQITLCSDKSDHVVFGLIAEHHNSNHSLFHDQEIFLHQKLLFFFWVFPPPQSRHTVQLSKQPLSVGFSFLYPNVPGREIGSTASKRNCYSLFLSVLCVFNLNALHNGVMYHGIVTIAHITRSETFHLLQCPHQLRRDLVDRRTLGRE